MSKPHNIIVTPYASVLENIEYSTLVSGITGGVSNLLAEHINDYSTHGINSYVAEWLHDNASRVDTTEIECILDNPDYLVQEAGKAFYDAMISMLNGDITQADNIIKNARHYFDSYGEYYIFAEPISNALARYYVIRAEGQEEAIQRLIYGFEQDFIVDDIGLEEDNEAYCYNDNGTACCIDNLVMLGSFQFTDK